MSEAGRTIEAADLERQLAHVRASAAGEAEGVFGPPSLLWRVDREAALFLGAGRALLLQLAHPWVAAGIAQHSTTLADPIGRFHRTFEIMFTLVFGSLGQALEAARRLHRRHAAVKGRLPSSAGRFEQGASYSASDPPALLWVHATLVETALVAHDLMLPPLVPTERERYYQESRVMGALFGLAPADLPPTCDDFAAYTEAMWRSDALAVTPQAREIAERVLSGAGSRLRPPGWYRALTASLVPEPLRAGFGLAYGEREARTAARALRRLRRLYPLLPEAMRFVGPYHEARGRLSGRARPGPVVRGLNRLWIGQGEMRPHRSPS